MVPRTADTSSTPRPREKGTLFCQSCWHESAVDGDWRVQATAAGRRLRCPDCGATVDERAEEMDTPKAVSASSDTRVSPAAQLVRLAFAWTAWPCTRPDESPAGSRRRPCHP